MERFYIGSTRFTNYTFKENSEWRERFKWKGCVYGCNKKMPLTVINPKYKMCVYKSDTNYNRYVYNSAHRKDRTEINKKLLVALEFILFKGHGHFKRGQGITTIPWKRFGDSGSDIYKLFQGLFN